MQEFKKGDMVLRLTTSNVEGVFPGGIYKVKDTTRGILSLCGFNLTVDADQFINISGYEPRPHPIERIAYAYGLDIEEFTTGRWSTARTPTFNKHTVYRIKQKDPVLQEIAELEQKLEELKRTYEENH